MTESQILRWIKNNLSGDIKVAIQNSQYTEEILAGMTMRETGFLIARYVGEGKMVEEINLLMRGDYGQRPGESKKQFHGYGYTQIDIKSFPDFINSGDWQNPLKCYEKSVEVLNDKAQYLAKYNITSLQAVLAAYNCGEGNIRKAVQKGLDVDIYTYNKNYSKELIRFSEIYKSL